MSSPPDTYPLHMPHEDHPGSALVTLALVPARAAYLVRAGSRKGIRRAVQEASTRWGGLTEPIIPTRRNGTVDSWWRHVVRVANVDALVDVDAGPALAESVAETFGLPLIAIKDIDRAGPTRWTTHPSSLPNRGDPTQAPVIACENGPLWQAVAAGDFSPEHDAAHRDAFRFRRPHGSDEVARASLHGQTLLDRTVESCPESHTRGGVYPVPAMVWVTAKDSTRDCLWFWNFRALQSRRIEPSPMLLLPVDDVRHWLNFPRDLHSLLSRPEEFSPDVSLMSMTVPEEVLHSFAINVLSLEHTERRPYVAHKWPTPQRTAPFTYQLNLDLRDHLVFDREYGEEVELEVHPANGKALARFASPVRFNGGAYTMLRLTSTLFDGFPRKNVVAEKVVNNGFWRGDFIRIATNAMREYRLEINLPTLEDCVQALVASRTSEFRLSEQGRMAEALSADTDLTVLLRSGVYEAATHLTTPRPKLFRREMEERRAKGVPEHEVEAFGARWGGRGARTYDDVSGFIARYGKAYAAPAQAFETLCEIGWAERGAETNCARCGLRTFVPIATLDRGARCPGCRAATSYTTDTTGLAVQYRLNTLIDLACDQGVLPHLLVIAALTQRCRRVSLLGGTLVTLPGGSTPEVDILGIYDRQFVAGEVKTKASDFTQEQLERDISVSSRLNVDTHILATVDAVPDAVFHAAHKLADAANLPLLVLSRNELRRSDPSQ
jgi:hypothetical protein